MVIRKIKYVIPSIDSVEYNLRGKTPEVDMPYILVKGNDPVRTLTDNDGNIKYNAFYLVNPNVASFLSKHYESYEQIKDGSYSPKTKTGRKETSFVKDHVFKGDTNYYSNCSVADYISKCTTGKPTRTMKETWANLPVPIAFNTIGADRVVVTREGKEIVFAATGKLTYIYNFIPNREYVCKIANGDKILRIERFTTSGEIRQIYLENIHNVRDIGGKACYDDNGNYIGELDYGRIFRGKSLVNATPETLSTLVNDLGVEIVLDLSKENNENLNGVVNLLGTTYGWGTKDIYIKAVEDNSVKAIIKKDIEIIASYLDKGKNIYIHCEGGMDRTGTICFILESICGCNLDAVIHDWELSALTYSGGIDEKTGTPCRIDSVTKLLYIIKYLRNNFGKNGESLRQQTIAWLNSFGVTSETIVKIQNMLCV